MVRDRHHPHYQSHTELPTPTSSLLCKDMPLATIIHDGSDYSYLIDYSSRPRIGPIIGVLIVSIIGVMYIRAITTVVVVIR